MGISPAGSHGDVFSSFTFSVYVPGESSATSAYSDWTDIPYWSSSTNVSGRSGLLGDICSIINAAYRLPKDGEFGTSNGWGVWQPEGTRENLTVSDTGGTYDFMANGHYRAVNVSAGNIILPAAGFLGYYAGAVSWVGREGWYWTGSARTDYPQYLMVALFSDNMAPNNGVQRTYGYSVRCVRD